MKSFIFFLILVFAISFINAQDVSISGKVTDNTGAGLDGAILKLEKAGIVGKTSADGSFKLANTVSIEDNINVNMRQRRVNARLSKGLIYLEVDKKGTFAINLYNLQGEVITSLKRSVNSGTNIISLPSVGRGVYVTKIESNNKEFVFKGCTIEGFTGSKSWIMDQTQFAQGTADLPGGKLFNDTIRVTKSGYLNSFIPVVNSDTSGMNIEMKVNAVVLPEDHCFHNNVSNEWVYFSGVVETSEGKEFGLMFTIFGSFSAMLGIADPETKIFHDKRMGGGGNAGKTQLGLPDIKSGDSRFLWDPADNLHITSSANASGVKIAVDIDMTPTKEILFHGEDGYIPMGDNIPSGYFSLTNLLPTKGTLSIGDKTHTVTGGKVWMDRQWGNWTGAGYAWDWFALRFDDGGALMLFQFRDASQNPSIGNWTYRDKDGLVYYGTDFKVTAHRKYNRFPIDWTVKLPSINAEFEIDPIFDAQTFTGLWEGLCDVKGKIGSNQLSGQAFVELNAY